MALRGLQDNGVADFGAGNIDTLVISSASGERKSIDHAVVHNRTAVAGYIVEFYKSPTNASADGKRICRFKLGAHETYIPEIVGVAIGAGQKLIGKCTAPGAGDVNITITYTSADGTD
jgi:hypothetical protein